MNGGTGYELGAASISGAAQRYPARMALSAQGARVTGGGAAAPATLRGRGLDGDVLTLSDGVLLAFTDLADLGAARFAEGR